MSQDDDDDDDAKLRSLRAVWLAMPDEEPPERGLDALMAAARTKASQMAEGSSELPKATSWWERFVAGFRRPAVLALATVVVLVAGAVLFSHRGIKATAPNGTGASPSNEDVPTERREHESLKQEAPPPPSDDNASPHQLAAPEVPGGIVQQGAKEATQSPLQGEDSVVVDHQQLESAVKDEQAAKDRAKQKLLDEAKMAAARGDCANAKVVARQLEQQDLGYYRSRVAPDPGIASCLADRKAAGATIDNATSTGRATTQPAE